MATADSEQTRQWVEAARSGDDVAFEALLRQFQDAVVAVVLTRLGPGSDMEDVAQEAFIQAFTNLSQLREADKFGPWICKIAKNRCLQHRRSHGKCSDLPADVEAKRKPQRGELSERVMAKVQKMPLRLRSPLMLFYINGYSTKEVSDLLEVPYGTVRRRLHEARQLLRGHMEKTMEDAIKRKAPKPEFTKKVHKSFIVAKTRKYMTTMSSDKPGYTKQKAKKDALEILDLFEKGQYEFKGTEDHEVEGRKLKIYLYKFKLSDGDNWNWASNEPFEQTMLKLAKAVRKK